MKQFNNLHPIFHGLFVPDDGYGLIYADPPWLYKDKAKAGDRGAESHYICTDLDELKRMVPPAADNSVCFMWVTFPQMPVGLELLQTWGFEYKTVGFTWVKVNKNLSVYMGMGNHTRANAEICLLGIKGKGLKRFDAGIKQTQLHGRGKHSEKPNEFRKDLIKLYGPDVDRLEMFARAETFDSALITEFDVCGNEA